MSANTPDAPFPCSAVANHGVACPPAQATHLRGYGGLGSCSAVLNDQRISPARTS